MKALSCLKWKTLPCGENVRSQPPAGEYSWERVRKYWFCDVKLWISWVLAVGMLFNFDTAQAATESQYADFRNIAPSRGFRLSSSGGGISVGNAGDMNGDGISDMIVGYPFATVAGMENAGVTFVVFGRNSTFPSDFELVTMVTGRYTGFRILGVASNDQCGASVSGAGDVNGDGVDDVIVGAPFADPGNLIADSNAGKVYVIFGRRVTSNADAFIDIDFNFLTTGPTTMFRIYGGLVGMQSGYSVSGAGDVNGDNIADMIVGAPHGTPTVGRENAGISYVVFGTANPVNLYLSTIVSGATTGFRILGAASNDYSGNSVRGAGDVNGDGVADVIVGAVLGDADAARVNSGLVYVIFGSVGSGARNDVDLSTWVTGRLTGFRILGASGGDRCGVSVNHAGDVNGDGVSDIIVGAHLANPSLRTSAGISYVIFGRKVTISDSAFTDIDTNLLVSSPTRGFRILGAVAGDNSGIAVSGAGDMNGDGLDDVIVGAYLASSPWVPSSGVSYVIFGRPQPADIDLLHMETGFPIFGAATGDQSGYSVSASGDINHDGLADVIVGPGSYVVYGTKYFDYPTSQPSSQPSRQPTGQPTAQPTQQPVSRPSSQLSLQPTCQPSSQPSRHPSTQPTSQPTTQPTSHPSGQPLSLPSSQPTVRPTVSPSAQPTMQPSGRPSCPPSCQPSALPSGQPSRQPLSSPSTQPTSCPTTQPSWCPTSQPSAHPSIQPSTQPSRLPSSTPTGQPSRAPSAQPSSQPFNQPSSAPSVRPSVQPSQQPSSIPSMQPSAQPTMQPTAQPTARPSMQPSCCPSCQPSNKPSASPSSSPSKYPTELPTVQPSAKPSSFPSAQPSSLPSSQPTSLPSAPPSAQPTDQPSVSPTLQPSAAPSAQPSSQPVARPSAQPSCQPTRQPSSQPSSQPSVHPSAQPSRQPTAVPSSHPTNAAPTGEWATTVPSVLQLDKVAFVNNEVWACGLNSDDGAAACVLADYTTGVIRTQYRFGWDSVTSVITVTDATKVFIGGHTAGAASTTSQVANCQIEPVQLTCTVKSFLNTNFLGSSYSPLTALIVYVGKSNNFATATIVDTTSQVTDKKYYYVSTVMSSIALMRAVSPPNFVGAFVAGTGVSGASTNRIITGWVRLLTGDLTAMYLTPSSGVIVNSADLVTAMALEPIGPDSFIVGALEVSTRTGAYGYLLRVNSLYRTVQYAVRYVKNTADRRLLSTTSSISLSKSVVRGLARVDNILFLVLEFGRVNVTNLSVIKADAATGSIIKEATISSHNASIACSDIISAALLLDITCTVQRRGAVSQQAQLISVDRELSFTRLPVGFKREPGDLFSMESVFFTAAKLEIIKQSTAITTIDSPLMISNEMPTYRPTRAPTVSPSAQPSSAPSVSANPTSQPSTSGPTNTYKPSAEPTVRPTATPTLTVTARPSKSPTASPSTKLSAGPSLAPTAIVSLSPLAKPTSAPTPHPTRKPTAAPSTQSTTENILEDDEDGRRAPAQHFVIAVSVMGSVLLVGVCAFLFFKRHELRVNEVSKKFFKVVPSTDAAPPTWLTDEAAEPFILSPSRQASEIGSESEYSIYSVGVGVGANIDDDSINNNEDFSVIASQTFSRSVPEYFSSNCSVLSQSPPRDSIPHDEDAPSELTSVSSGSRSPNSSSSSSSSSDTFDEIMRARGESWFQ